MPNRHGTGGRINLYLQVGGGRASTLLEFSSDSDANLWLNSCRIRQGYGCGASGVDAPSRYGNGLWLCSRR